MCYSFNICVYFSYLLYSALTFFSFLAAYWCLSITRDPTYCNLSCSFSADFSLSEVGVWWSFPLSGEWSWSSLCLGDILSFEKFISLSYRFSLFFFSSSSNSCYSYNSHSFTKWSIINATNILKDRITANINHKIKYNLYILLPIIAHPTSVCILKRLIYI